MQSVISQATVLKSMDPVAFNTLGDVKFETVCLMAGGISCMRRRASSRMPRC